MRDAIGFEELLASSARAPLSSGLMSVAPRIALLIAVIAAGCARGEAQRGRVRLATTTSTEASGLLADILPPFEREEGIEVQVVAVGTGQALELGRRGDADVVLVHVRTLEDEFVAQGQGVDRRDVMWNDFIILGPPSDPAGVRGSRDAVDAFRRIKGGGHTFVSRGDNSGTHVRELDIWSHAGGVPEVGDHYLQAGQGMGTCLVLADQRDAYIFADRGTYLAFRRRLDLDVLVEGDVERLRNPYGMILIDPRDHPHVNAEAARALLDYFTSPRGQRRIGAFQVDGQVLFHPGAG